jgi:hypothetical protein
MSKPMLLAVAIVMSTAAQATAGAVVAPKSDLPLRSSPPGTFFKGKGDKVGNTSPRERYRVLEKRSVPTVTGREEWLRVESIDDPGKGGWIYGGSGGDRTVSPR